MRDLEKIIFMAAFTLLAACAMITISAILDLHVLSAIKSARSLAP
jgi:hypothetical protein